MDIWKSKVLPKIKLVFVKSAGKKAAAAAELVKSFDESKEGINGEFQEKKADLLPKVVEIYESAPAPLKVLIKERSKVSGIKKNSAAITKFFEELAKIEFPGAKQVSDGISKVGPVLLSGPIFSTFEKVSTLLPVAAEEATATKEAPAATEEAAAVEEKKEEAAAAAAEKKEEAEQKKEETTTPAPAAAETAPPADAAAAAAEPTAEAAPAAEAAPEAEAAAAPAAAEAEPAKAEEETPKA
ncbi:hypothetical protein BDA96_04G136900 [Sorghum bicolor]|uniref:Plasma membrane-associated cation-binding protein 1 n=1 Tax=Sorghum bicolor TaxID=4558 RepID=A0A921R2L8_SORBI|nr:hypothetical protein BDA96_04G136900 [Sorghum bicolor]